jgi:hypothetical protein
MATGPALDTWRSPREGTHRIQLGFNHAGLRYRPTITAAPAESNLQRARSKLKRIRVRSANGTFCEEFTQIAITVFAGQLKILERRLEGQHPK